jgi:integrase/recombinase XerD
MNEAWSRCTVRFRCLVSEWMQFLRSLPILPDTLSKHRTHLLHLGLYLRAKRLSLGKVGYSDVMTWLTELRAASTQPGTINVRLSTARRFFRWLRITGHVSGTPFSGIGPLRLPARLPRHLTKLEMSRVVRAARGIRDKAAVTLLYVTGCRTRELTRLNLTDVSLRHRTVTYRGPYGPGARTIPLGSEGFAVLRPLVAQRRREKPRSCQDYPLFVNSQRRRLTAPALQRLVLGLGEKANVGRHVIPRMIRHSFGAHFCANGGDVMTLRSALGLSTLAAAQSYTRLAIGRLREVYERTHPRK